MDTFKIIFNDNSEHVYPKGTSFYEVSKDFPMDNIVAYKVNNEVFSLDHLVSRNAKIEFINTDDLIGYKRYKAGLKFLFQVALQELYGDLDVNYEHSVPKGMLGKIDSDRILSKSEIENIKNKMLEIVNNNERIEKLNVSPKDAIKYYLQKGEIEKAHNIQNIADRVVRFYKLRGKLNYFYSVMPYSTGVLNKFDLLYLNDNRIIFLFPTVDSKGKIPEYVHFDNIIKSFDAGKKWLINMRIPYLTDLNKIISESKIKDFIKSCELHFNNDIAKVADNIIKKGNVKFVLISGPSSSGKTTTTSRLSSYFESIGYNTIKLSLDDYFIDRDLLPVDSEGKKDFESVNAIDIKFFNEQLSEILAGKEVITPSFNFITGKREMNKDPVKLDNNTIFLIEGLHALNEELTKDVEEQYKYKIYLSPFIPLNIDKQNYISTIDLRLLRRMIRDNRTRGYGVVDTMDIWQSVRNGEEKYIFPNINHADEILNTALAYEVGVLKVFVEPLLLSVSVDSKYYEEARRLVDFLKQFFSIPGEYVNDESILREFIGGKYND